MAFKLGLGAAFLTLAVLLPAQAQTPEQGNEKNSLPAVVAAPQFCVFGEVNRPGSYRYKQGYHLSDALSSAAGPTRNANLTHVLVIRFDKAHKTAAQQTVDFNGFVLKGNTKINPLIADGDAFYVTSRKHPFPFKPQLITQGQNRL